MACNNIQKSLAWCEGKSSYPGIRKKIFYISKSEISKWPVREPNAAGYTGNFTLAADAKWFSIDCLANKSSVSSEAVGEAPSQLQQNKGQFVLPGTDKDFSSLAHYVNNNDSVFIVQTMNGEYRILGAEEWPVTAKVAQDSGKGTDSASTTLDVEALDQSPAPFYTGTITTEDGVINAPVEP